MISYTKARYQERNLVAMDGEEIRHDDAPDDMILNLAQMRNAWILQVWQPVHPFMHLDIDEAARRGVRRQYAALEEEAKAKEARKEAQDAKRAVAKSKARDWRTIVSRPNGMTPEARL